MWRCHWVMLYWDILSGSIARPWTMTRISVCKNRARTHESNHLFRLDSVTESHLVQFMAVLYMLVLCRTLPFINWSIDLAFLKWWKLQPTINNIIIVITRDVLIALFQTEFKCIFLVLDNTDTNTEMSNLLINAVSRHQSVHARRVSSVFLHEPLAGERATAHFDLNPFWNLIFTY